MVDYSRYIRKAEYPLSPRHTGDLRFIQIPSALRGAGMTVDNFVIRLFFYDGAGLCRCLSDVNVLRDMEV